MEKTFSIDELKQFNGVNGNPAYIAVQGVVYDVTQNRSWNNGRHYRGVLAGNDLTDEIMMQSPHGPSVLQDCPVVGKLMK